MKKLLVVLVVFISSVRSDCLANETEYDHQLNNINPEQRNNFTNESLYESSSNDDEKKEVSDKWDCSKEETEKQQSLVTANGMINIGQEEINKQNGRTQNTILVLGNAGAGKTTFVQFMAGDNSKMISKEVGSDSGLYLIEDDKKIGSSVSESFTLYPEQVVTTDNNASFTDTPGFSDTRSPEHELVATYVMKKYLKNIKNIKIVLLVNYNSVQQGIYKNDFVELLRNIISFIRDIQKYKNNIVLVATKVPNMYKTNKNNITLISDEKVIEGIAEYLSKLKTSLSKKLLNSKKHAEKTFLKNCLHLIQSLQETDMNGNYKKLNIFRRPSEPGILLEIPLLQQEKESIKKTVFDNINYTNLLEDDIGFVLSDRAKNYLNCLLWYINDKVINMLSSTYSLIKNHYEMETNNHTDIYELTSSLYEVFKKLKILKDDLKLSDNYNNYSTILKQFISDENIKSDVIDNNTDFEIKEYLNNLHQFTEMSSILSTVEWTEQMEDLLNFIEENLSWYRFLTKVFEHLSLYNIQKSKSYLYNPIDEYKNTNDYIKTILFDIDELLYKNLDSYINFMNLRENRKKDLEDIVSFTIENKTNISCDSDGKFIITGNYIVISSLKNAELKRQYCGNNTIKTIIVYGFHKVFIDADLTENYFKGVDLIIAAPTWEIIGKREINIDGIPGNIHNNLKADDGKKYGDNGKNGLAGLPGGNSGNFLGIVRHIENEESLIISLKGGKGGPGQNGGNGKNGINGKDGFQKFSKTPNNNEYNEIWEKGLSEFPQNYTNLTTPKLVDMRQSYCYEKIRIYFHDGDCGGKGGFGGTGGPGGIGGYPGTVLLLGLNDPPKVSTKISHGDSGVPGINGNDGQKGEDGKPVTCFQSSIHYTSSYSSPASFWRCTNFTYNTNKCSKIIDVPRLNTTEFNFSQLNSVISLPVQSNVRDFSIEIHNYILILKNIRENKLISKNIDKFLNQIYKNILTMKNYFWKFIFFNETSSS